MAIDLEAIKARLADVEGMPVGTGSEAVEFLHGGKRDKATAWAIKVRRDQAELIAEVERLQGIEQATKLQKTQAHFYQDFSRRLMATYMKLYPEATHYSDEMAFNRILNDIQKLRQESES